MAQHPTWIRNTHSWVKVVVTSAGLGPDQTAGGIGTIIIEIRFAMGQMDGTPDVKSSYKLVTKDWSGLLGVFRK